MNKRTPLTNQDGEVRELTADDLRLFKPAHDVLPAALQEKLGMRARPPKGPAKGIDDHPAVARCGASLPCSRRWMANAH